MSVDRRDVDVLVVGAGPAGLTAAAELARAGVRRVEVLERELEAGGIPRHSHHTGYGMRDLRRVLTGPQYARRLLGSAQDAGVAVRLGATVTGWASPGPNGRRTVTVTAPAGLESITAGAVVLATGARERPRAARLVAGDRPAGVYTTGELQQAVLARHTGRAGRAGGGPAGPWAGIRAVVIGAEDVSYSAVMMLGHAGARVVAMVTDLPQMQSYPVFAVGALLRYGVRAVTDATVTRVIGRERVEAVELRHADGRTARIACDTVVFTGDWIPDHELARRAELAMDAGTRGPVVSSSWATSLAGVFAAGNLVHPVATADLCALGARAAAGCVLEYLSPTRPTRPTRPTARTGSPEVPVQVEPPLRWAVPQQVAPGARPPGRFLIWADREVPRPVLRVVQAGRMLHEQRLGRVMVPRRALPVVPGWVSGVDPHAGPVTVSVTTP
jgi:thioredoxin reductase